MSDDQLSHILLNAVPKEFDNFLAWLHRESVTKNGGTFVLEDVMRDLSIA